MGNTHQPADKHQSQSVTRKPLPLSACIITYNEADRIEACLQSLSFCAELIIVDSHSTDQTRTIARKYTKQVIERDWPGHIEQKNWAISKARYDWVLCVDADERISDPLRQSIVQVFQSETIPYTGFRFPRCTCYMGKWIRHCGWYPDKKLRLFRVTRGRWTGVNPHDHVTVDGTIGELSGDLLHYSYRNVADHIRTMNSFSSISAREKLKQGQKWIALNLLFNPPFKFLKMFILKLGFMDGWQGLMCSMMGAFYVFLKYLKLLELQYLMDAEEEKSRSSYEADETLSGKLPIGK